MLSPANPIAVLGFTAAIAAAIAVSPAATATTPAHTIVRLDTSLGPVHIELLDQTTPLTVENFLSYLDGGWWDGAIFHRLVPGFVLQGGGFLYRDEQLFINEQFDPVPNEPGVSNTRGTLAMAKLADDPDSATNQFFFNLDDNSANLDHQNEGFTVFARVIGNDMEVVDELASQQVWDGSGIHPAWSQLPLIDYEPGSDLGEHLLLIEQATVVGDYFDVGGSGVLEVSDIDLLLGAIRDGVDSPHFDLNRDGVVDLADLDFLLAAGFGTVRGDVNLDGRVDLRDVAALFQGWGPTDGGWQAGDLTGDGAVGPGDLAWVLDNFPQGGTSQALVVPEPTAAFSLLIGSLVLGLRRRR